MVARVLCRHGVRHLFTLCGGHIQALYDGCLDEAVQVIDFRHEQAAAFAADATSRVTGGVGVAAVTAGPGVTNAVTAIANALRAQSPMLVLGGAAPVALAGRGALQEMPTLEVVRPITKAAWTVAEARRLPEAVARAFSIARSGVPGPVYLELPADVLFATVREGDITWPEPAPVPVLAPDPAAVTAAAGLLYSAERPVCILGSQFRWSPWANAGPATGSGPGGPAEEHHPGWPAHAATCGEPGVHPPVVEEFAEAYGLPVYTSGMARGALAPDSSWAFARSRRYALAEADVVLVLGTPLDFRLGYGQAPAWSEAARLIHVDLDPAEPGRNRRPTLALGGDAGAVMASLAAARPHAGHLRKSGPAGTQAGAPPRTAAWLAELRSRETPGRAFQAAGAGPAENGGPARRAGPRLVPLPAFLEALDAALPDDVILVGDGGDVVGAAAGALRVRGYPGRWLDPGPLGTLGIAPAFAMAARLARPEAAAVVLYGDGAFGFNAMEYEAAVRQRIPFLGLVGNDAAWSQIRRGQVAMYGPDRAPATALDYTRYEAVVQALGGFGAWADTAEAVGPAVRKALASGLPACVNVPVDPGDVRAGSISI